jgi:hypothetical protein
VIAPERYSTLTILRTLSCSAVVGAGTGSA